VFEFIDDIRDQIWAIYGPRIQCEIQSQRQHHSVDTETQNKRSDP
jgi:hypothetical protein